jgi:hypothetical protein
MISLRRVPPGDFFSVNFSSGRQRRNPRGMPGVCCVWNQRVLLSPRDVVRHCQESHAHGGDA